MTIRIITFGAVVRVSRSPVFLKAPSTACDVESASHSQRAGGYLTAKEKRRRREAWLHAHRDPNAFPNLATRASADVRLGEPCRRDSAPWGAESGLLAISAARDESLAADRGGGP